MLPENLSKSLFKPTIKVTETSMIANSRAESAVVQPVPELLEGVAKPSWYRLQRRGWWAWNEIQALETEQLLATIAASNKPRTSELIDTIANYQPGNWNYEWVKRAVGLQTLAQQVAEGEDPTAAIDLYMQASFCASIAAYPHLRGDELAANAQTLVHTNYRAAGALLRPKLQELKVPFKGKRISCYLHLPQDNSPCPVVMVSGGIDNLQTEFWRVYRDYLAPQGFAMLTVDLPGAGSNWPWRIGQDSSEIHQAVLTYLEQVPWVDSNRVAIMGARFGGNIAARLAFIEPKRVKAAVCIGAGANLIFTDHKRFNLLPQMLKDCLANRMGLDAANVESLYYRCHSLSLKSQGLLGATRTSVPLLSMGHKDDHICPAADIELLANSSKNGESYIAKDSQIFDLQHRLIKHASEWLVKIL